MSEENKTNEVFDDIHKMIRGLRKHIDETDCEHCKELFRKILASSEEKN